MKAIASSLFCIAVLAVAVWLITLNHPIAATILIIGAFIFAYDKI